MTNARKTPSALPDNIRKTLTRNAQFVQQRKILTVPDAHILSVFKKTMNRWIGHFRPQSTVTTHGNRGPAVCSPAHPVHEIGMPPDRVRESFDSLESRHEHPPHP